MPGKAAANFTLVPPAAAYDPLQIAALAKQGVFKDKKVGVMGGFTTDEDEMKIVESALAKNHVHVVQTGVNSAPATDQVASFQQIGVMSQRFQNAGVNLVVAVGQGSAAWPDAQQTNQSTYNPPWVGTSYSDLAGYTIGKSSSASYVENALTTTPLPSAESRWKDPQIQKCVHTIRKAYPGDAIASPIGQPASDTSDTTYVSAMNACQNVAIFAAIAKAAGKNLTVSTFTHAGEGLHDILFPAAGSAVSFNGKAYAIGDVYLRALQHQRRPVRDRGAPGGPLNRPAPRPVSTVDSSQRPFRILAQRGQTAGSSTDVASMSPTRATPKRRMVRSTSSRKSPRMRSTPGRPAAHRP